MFYRISRTSLCLQKVLSKARPLPHLPHSHEYHWVGFMNNRFEYPSNISALQYHCSFCLLEHGKVNVCVFNKRFYSDFKDDDMVKSWIKEIKEDFEKKNSNSSESSEDYFKDVEAVNDVVEEIGQLDKNANLSLEEQVSLEKLEELANRYAEVEVAETESSSSDSSSDSDSDLLSSASESDSSDDESDNKAIGSVTDQAATDQDGVLRALEGFTKEEMIEMLKNNEIKETSEVDLEELDSGLENDDVTDNKTESSESAADTAGIAATRIGKEGLNDDWGVVEIEDFVNLTPEPEVQAPWVPPISLERGKTGVFDVEEMVTLLRSANVFDIVVIRLPKAIQLGDHMVIASAKSLRHLTAVSKDIQWIYKKRVKKGNVHLRVEGEKTKWHAMDIGNIFLHLFLPEVREVYDLETLWTVGPAYDEKCREQGTDPYVFSIDDLPWLKELESGNQSSEEQQRDQRTDKTDTRKNSSRN